MMNRMWRNAGPLAGLCSVGVLALLVGCQDSTPQTQAVAPPPPPPAPVKPAVTPVSELMAQLNIDPRIVLPEEKAPPTTSERKAVLELFDGFARGDNQVVGSYISFSDRPLLEDLVATGQWKEATSGITQIRLETGVSPEGDNCVLAIIQSGTKFQPQLWKYSSATDMGGKEYMFDSVHAPPDMMNKLSGTDWIAEWFKIVDAEMQLAQVPDVELAPAQQILDENTSGDDMGGGSDPAITPATPRGPMRAPGTPVAPSDPPGRGPNGPKKR